MAVDLLAFVPACLALNLALGPSNLLSITYGAQRSIGFAFCAGLARIAAFIPMIAASALGLGLLLQTSAFAFNVLKTLGAGYLIYLGIRLLFSRRTSAPVATIGTVTLPQALRVECLAALSNPKAILVFAAFFPHFIDQRHYVTSYLVIGAVFLALEMVAIIFYATLGRVTLTLAGGRVHWLQRASGVAMITFGVILAFIQHPARS